MTKRLKIGVIGLVVTSAAVATIWLGRPTPVFEIPLRKSSRCFPLIDIDIQGEKYPICLALSSKYPLSLDEGVLAILHKSQGGEGNSKDILGDQSHFPTYWLPCLRLGGMIQKHIHTIPSDHDSIDGVGCYTWPVEELNLLLDLPHRKIIGIKKNSDLAKLGYDLSKMTKVDFHIAKNGLSFELNTSVGKLAGTLITACNHNLIRKDRFDEKGPVKLGLEIGGDSIEETSFTPYPVTSKLEYDLMLGTPFLGKHIVYLDPKGGHLYIGNHFASSISHRSPTCIPLEMSPSGCPVLKIEIDKKTHPVMLDTGSSAELLMRPDLINDDKLTFLYNHVSYNGLGDEHESALYILPSCQIGGAKANNLFLNLETKHGAKTPYTLSKPYGAAVPNGYLGLPFLNRTNVYLDLLKKHLWLVEKPDDLRKIKIYLNLHHKVPFTLEQSGIILTFETDLGDLRLLLDTGSSFTLIKPERTTDHDPIEDSHGNSPVLTHTFILDGHDYGSQNLYPLEITSKLGEIDGILGVDFLRKHPCYIDYRNRAVYFLRIPS